MLLIFLKDVFYTEFPNFPLHSCHHVATLCVSWRKCEGNHKKLPSRFHGFLKLFIAPTVEEEIKILLQLLDDSS